MKRVKAACILQTLVFSQKPETEYDKAESLCANRKEVEHYINMLEQAKTRYQIDTQEEQEDGSIIVRIKKQYSDKADVSEYFD